MKPGTAIFVMIPLVVVVGAFVFLTMRGAGAGSTMDGVVWNEQIARFVRQKVALTYVDELDHERATHAFYRALDAYVHDLDQYCDFIPPDEYRREREETSGEYAGLGVKIEGVPEGLVVVGVLPGGPADQAGIHPGDTIVSAGTTSLAGLALAEIERSGLLKGAPKSTVVVGVLPGPRPDKGPPPGPPRPVKVVRDVVRPPTVFSRRVGPNGDVGVIRLSGFAEATEQAFDDALSSLRSQGIDALVLDLRENPGGVLPTAVGIVNRFVERGVVVRMEGRTPSANRVYEAVPEKATAKDMPLVVLVNGDSASASEVVAGSLQDHRRALLVGVRTYGKFLVQQITDIPGEDMAVKLTTSRYYLPSGRSYQRHPAKRLADGTEAPAEPAGLLPDVVLPLSDSDLTRLKAFQQNEEARTWRAKLPAPDVPADWVDPQLEKAIGLLRGQLALTRIREGGPATHR